MPNYKPVGECPFCRKMVRAYVIEENYLRRDKCNCPECHETVYVCRRPGCHNYAKGGTFWDDELCPSCTSGFVDYASNEAASKVVTLIGTALTALFISKSGKK